LIFYDRLLFQICKPFLYRLNLQLKVSQIGFQLSGLFGFGQIATLEARISTAAFAAAIAAFPAVTISMLAITGFVRHVILLSSL
jgi:hypothetical protein